MLGQASARVHYGRVARRHLSEGLARIFLRQAWTEFMIFWRKRVRFRSDQNGKAVQAYCAMTTEEFEGINALQRWANWRTIPRNLHRRLSAAPCRAVDLCAGVGDSTQVLAYYLPPGSEILGLEYNPAFVAAAARRVYQDSRGERADVTFRAQSVSETFRDSHGTRLLASSIDIVNSCGSLGIHFDSAAIEGISAEIARVLKRGGLAAIDSGREGVGKEKMIQLFGARGFEMLSCARSCFLDRFTQICFRKA